MAAKHRALPFFQLIGQVKHLMDLERIEHLLVCPLGEGIDDRLPDVGQPAE